jgi:hypothetical protein
VSRQLGYISVDLRDSERHSVRHIKFSALEIISLVESELAESRHALIPAFIGRLVPARESR